MSNNNNNNPNRINNNLLDHALHLLQVATILEEKSYGEQQRIDAATKYYEAVYMVKQYLEGLANTPENIPIRQFLSEKASHYEKRASRLLSAATASTTETTPTSNSEEFVAMAATASTTETTPTSNSEEFVAMAVAVPIPTPPAVASAPFAATSAFACLPPITLQQLGSQADARLARAMDLDERQDTKAAIEEYMAAAELYLRCVKLVAEQQPERNQMYAIKFKRLIKGALDRVEQLKYPTPIRKQMLRGLDLSPIIMSRN